jgi:hypothetical protein
MGKNRKKKEEMIKKELNNSAIYRKMREKVIMTYRG